jgi:hypothetical protein
MNATKAELKWWAKLIDSDDGEIGVDDNGSPYIRIQSEKADIMKRVDEITRKMGVNGEVTIDPPEER